MEVVIICSEEPTNAWRHPQVLFVLQNNVIKNELVCIVDAHPVVVSQAGGYNNKNIKKLS